MSFSERFTNLLKKNGISAYKMASDIDGINEAMIGKWKSGKSLPSFEKIVLLSNYLGISTDYLLKGIEEPFNLNKATSNETQLTPAEKNLLRLYRKSTEKGQDLIQEMASEIWANNQRPKDEKIASKVKPDEEPQPENQHVKNKNFINKLRAEDHCPESKFSSTSIEEDEEDELAVTSQ